MRSSATLIASSFAPISSTPKRSSVPSSAKRDREVQSGLPAYGWEKRVGALALYDCADGLRA